LNPKQVLLVKKPYDNPNNRIYHHGKHHYFFKSPMTNRNSDNISRRLALIGLLSWWSSYQQHQIVASTRSSSNGPSLQHRVKRSRRSVNYNYNYNYSSSQRLAFTPVTHGTRFGSENEVEWKLRREVHPGQGILWVFQQHQGESQTLSEETIQEGNIRKLWRYLYDQFVGEEFLPSDGSQNNELVDTTTNNNNKNVAAEVEFEAVVSDDDSGNNSIVDSNNNMTTTTTTTIVNATNTTGNITESVVYTTTVDDERDNNSNESDSTFTVDIDNEDNNDVVEEPQFQPLRMRAILAEAEDSGNGSQLSEQQRNILFHDMLSPALLAWSSSLRVDPVEGNLTVDVHQLLDGETCGPGRNSGLPSIRVPLQHLTDGIPETDMIIYLSLGFPPTVESDNNETDVSDSLYDGPYNSSNEEDTEEGSNDDYEIDLIVADEESLSGLGSRIKDHVNRGGRSSDQHHRYLITEDSPYREESPVSQNDTNRTSIINVCTGDYLAAASYCSTDQNDRPTAALLHICIDDSFFDIKHRRRNIMTLVHELGHALGFNALSMAHFRYPDGTPMTPRNKDGDVPDTTVECTGPDTEHQLATLALPSEEILRFRNVRGGVRVAEIITPSVVQVVRNQFDCQHLTGAELESGEGSPLSITGDGGCIGDHWERRLFSSDVMNPIVDDIEYSTRISTLTLAYFADSGWYQVDLSNADVASGWGRGAGCQFVRETCINEFGNVPPQNAPFFCNDAVNDHIPGLSNAQLIHGCTPDLSRKARCSIGQYNLELPRAYQYFNSTYGADVGGSDTLMDFCPVYDGFENGLCSSPESENVIRANDVERFGLRNSRCLLGNILPFYQDTALCLPIACVLEDRSLRVKVDLVWHICEEAGLIIQSKSVTITCPDPRRICPTFFCPFDCLGTGGKCDYNSGKCLCEYKNGSSEKTVTDACGIVEEIKAPKNSTSTTLRPILQGKGKKDAAIPPPDTKISDYYVSDVLHLDEPQLMDAMGIAIVTITGLLLVSFLVAIFMFRNIIKDALAMACNYFEFFRTQTEQSADDNFVEGMVTGSSEKDKMVATVLVDIRIRGNTENNWRRRHNSRRDLNESLAETEDPSPPPSEDALSEPSSRQMDSMSDLDSNTSQDVINKDSLPPEELPQVIRRRRFVPNMFA